MTPPEALSRSPGPGGEVDTTRVRTRRLSLRTLDEAMAEAERLAAGARAGSLRQLGNWTPGQIFGHLAWWVDGAFDGYPMRTTWLERVMARLTKHAVLRRPLPRGYRVPGAPEGTYGTQQLGLEEGLSRLRAAYGRLRAGSPARPHPAFGRMTHEEWVMLQLRHAENHLRFLELPGDEARE